MDNWERFKRTVRREKTDHVPTVLIGTSRFFASIAGFELSDVLHRPDLMLAAQKRTFELLPEVTFIPGAWPDYGVAILSAYGCRIFWAENGMPQVRGEIIRNSDDLKSLEIPKPETDGLMPHYLQTMRMFLDDETLIDYLHFTWSFGPGEMASYFCGVSQLFTGFIVDKQLAHGVLERATDGIITWVRAQLDINPRAEGLLLTDDISGMVSKAHYEEFIFPCHARIREAFPDLIIVFHNDAKSDHILESIANTGFEVFNFGKTTDINKCRDLISERICLMGNIDPLELMINGSVQEVSGKAHECLALFANKTGYMLSVGGGLNQGIPVENVRALVEATKEYGA
jgi:uroporphyrinogen decarboxylase